jgi:hypothetical protein
MKSCLRKPGRNTSQSEVTGVSPLGFWMIVDEKEYFVPFSDYPSFQKATVEQIFRVKRVAPTQLYWPELDVDIEIDALEQPEKYCLVYGD